MSNGSDPESITNKFLLADSKDYYHNRTDPHLYTNYPIKEDFFIGRDYLIVSKPIWKVLHSSYQGLEILRYSIAMDKIGKLFRDAILLKCKIALMR